MKEMLEDIRIKLINNSYENEEHVRLSLVSRIIQKLGWDIWNPQEVNTEYYTIKVEDKNRIDMALFAIQNEPAIFVEIKALGKIEGNLLEKVEEQLENYNRKNQALFSVITDGRIWHFYYAAGQGTFSRRRFKTLDLIEDEIEEIEDYLKIFISKESILNNSAKQETERLLQLNKKQLLMEESYTDARRMLEEDPLLNLANALVQVVGNKGLNISVDEAVQFIQERKEKPKEKIDNFPQIKPFSPKISKLPTSKDIVNSSEKTNYYNLRQLLELDIGKRKPKSLKIVDKSFQTNQWKNVDQVFVKYLIDEGYLSHDKMPIHNSAHQGKYFINDSPQHYNTNRKGEWKSVNGFFVDIKYSAKNHIANYLAALDQLGLSNLEKQIIIYIDI